MKALCSLTYGTNKRVRIVMQRAEQTTQCQVHRTSQQLPCCDEPQHVEPPVRFINAEQLELSHATDFNTCMANQLTALYIL